MLFNFLLSWRLGLYTIKGGFKVTTVIVSTKHIDMSGGVGKLRDIPEVLEFKIIVKLNTLCKWRNNKQSYNGHYRVQSSDEFPGATKIAAFPV